MDKKVEENCCETNKKTSKKSISKSLWLILKIKFCLEIDNYHVPQKMKKYSFLMKYLVILISSTSIVGSFYMYDTPFAIKQHLQDQYEEKVPTDFDYYFNLLYLVYTVPNIFLPFINGLIIQKVNYNKIVLFCMYLSYK